MINNMPATEKDFNRQRLNLTLPEQQTSINLSVKSLPLSEHPFNQAKYLIAYVHIKSSIKSSSSSTQKMKMFSFVNLELQSWAYCCGRRQTADG